MKDNGQEFQDRKLNTCEVCGTHKLLGVRTRDNGKVYFLCKGHAQLNDELQDAEQRLAAKRRRLVPVSLKMMVEMCDETEATIKSKGGLSKKSV